MTQGTLIPQTAEDYAEILANTFDASEALDDAPPVTPPTSETLRAVQAAGEDFEWYPTSRRMIDVVARQIPKDARSLMDIGAGDGRVLLELAKKCEDAELYAIEKSAVLVQAQPENVTPVGTDLFEQNLTCLPVDYIFCNPPYSQYETWACNIIESGYAQKAFLVLPQRWADSKSIAASLKKRGATARVIQADDFHNADRRARATINIIEVSFPGNDDSYRKAVKDPFDIWFDQNINTFDRDKQPSDDEREQGDELAKIRHLTTICDMVESFNEEHARMEENYRAIFKLDYALLKELGVSKDAVRDGIKKKMAGLKNRYWHLLFENLDLITSRLSTETKRKFREKLNGRVAIAFTSSNAYAVVIWAIKHANKYYDEQLIKLFLDLSTHDGVLNYKSNLKTWKNDAWRYRKEDHSHYALDYRIVLNHYAAIQQTDNNWGHPGGMHNSCHEQIDDIIAVMNNLGFATCSAHSRHRSWSSGQWHDFLLRSDDETLFQMKAYKNGNMHFRFKPEAIKRLNVEAGRLLGWIRTAADVVKELGYTPEEAAECFGANYRITADSMKLLAAPHQPNGQTP